MKVPDTQTVLEMFGIKHPVLLAPMAGATNAKLVAAVSNAGGLGGYGAAGARPQFLRTVIAEIRERTEQPFHINLFSAHTEVFDERARPGKRLMRQMEKYHQEFGLDAVPEPIALFGPAEEQLAVCVEQRVPVVSFHFGVDEQTVAKARSGGAKVLCSATTVAEAKIIEAAGADAVIAQGAEAGGHRGTFNGDYKQALIGTLALVPQIVDAVSIPVIAAGGVMDARGLVACRALGASMVQMGTAFLGCQEAPVADVWRRALREADAEDIVVTKVMSGKPARGIRNRYIEELENLEEELLPYPAQYSISRKLRQAAAAQGDGNFGAHWSGQGVGLYRDITVAELMTELTINAGDLARKLSQS